MMQDSPTTRQYDAAEQFTALAARCDSIAERMQDGKMDEKLMAHLVRVCADTIVRLNALERNT